MGSSKKNDTYTGELADIVAPETEDKRLNQIMRAMLEGRLDDLTSEDYIYAAAKNIKNSASSMSEGLLEILDSKLDEKRLEELAGRASAIATIIGFLGLASSCPTMDNTVVLFTLFNTILEYMGKSNTKDQSSILDRFSLDDDADDDITWN